MDAKTASNDLASLPKHDYEQVFPVFAPPPPQPRSNSDENEAPSSNAGEPRKAATLFWVNSDPQSVRGGSREATLKRIRSHVMSEHNRKKRLENTRRYNKGKSWKNLAFRPEPAGASSRSSPTSSDGSSAKDTPSPENGEDRSLQISPVKSEQESPATEVGFVHSPSGIIRDLQAGQVQEWEAATNGTSFTGAPWSYIGQGMTDPFDTTQVQLSDRQYGHVEFFLFDLVARAVPFKTHIIPKLRKHWTMLVQENTAPLHACITSAATNKALLSGDFFADPVTQRTSPFIIDRLHHRGETIKLVNLGLSNASTASSDALIAAVSILISIEIVGANAEYIAIHLAGLRKMVALRKHFSDIAPDVRSQIEWTDIRAACLNLSKPIFPFIRYARPASMPSLISPDNGGKLASRLRALAQIPGFFGKEMCNTIDDLLELSLYAEIARLQPQRAALLFDEQVEEYFNNEVLYTEYCIFSDRYTPNGLRGDDSIEGGVRLACLIFHNTAIWGFFPEMAAVLPQPVLALESSIRSGLATGLYRHYPDLLIWLLFIGACSAKFLRQRLFFMSELSTVVTAHGLQTFEEFHSLLGDFFYVDRCYLSECRDIWAHIHSSMLSPHQTPIV